MKKENTKYMSKKEYLKRYDSNVGYALYVQDNIKTGDYVRLVTGDIFKVIGIGKGKRIYYSVGEHDWFDCSAVTNFSDKIKDLIEADDIIELDNDNENKCQVLPDYEKLTVYIMESDYYADIKDLKIKAILTKEKYKSDCFKIEGE